MCRGRAARCSSSIERERKNARATNCTKYHNGNCAAAVLAAVVGAARRGLYHCLRSLDFRIGQQTTMSDFIPDDWEEWELDEDDQRFVRSLVDEVDELDEEILSLLDGLDSDEESE